MAVSYKCFFYKKKNIYSCYLVWSSSKTSNKRIKITHRKSYTWHVCYFAISKNKIVYLILFLVELLMMVLIWESKYSNNYFYFQEFSYFRIRIDIEGAPGTLYDGEKFQLLFKFTDQYPFDSPQVIKLYYHI
jgi:hypothetical protein